MASKQDYRAVTKSDAGIAERFAWQQGMRSPKSVDCGKLRRKLKRAARFGHGNSAAAELKPVTETLNANHGIGATTEDRCKAPSCKAGSGCLDGSGSGASEAGNGTQNANNAMGLGTNSTQSRTEGGWFGEIIASCQRHLIGDPDAHATVCAALTYIAADEGRIRFGNQLRCNDVRLVKRSIEGNWGARPDKFREAVRDLLETLKGESRRPALAAFEALQSAVKAGLIPDVSRVAIEHRGEELAAFAGVPIQ